MTEDKIEDKIAEIKARHKAGPLGQMPREDRMSNFLRWQWLLGEVDRRGAEIEKQREAIKRLREVIRTIRARCVELDDSDAVSETLDIATAALEDEP